MQKINWPYSVPDLLRLLYSFIVTKIFFSFARLIRQPCRIRGLKYMQIGNGFTTGSYCRLEAGILDGASVKPVLVIGNNVQLNDMVHIGALHKIIIGDNVLVASRVYITDHDHGNTHDLSVIPSLRKVITKEVNIGSNVWIGEGCIILKGVALGDNTIVGAGSVVTKSFPPNSVLVGVPARNISDHN